MDANNYFWSNERYCTLNEDGTLCDFYLNQAFEGLLAGEGSKEEFEEFFVYCFHENRGDINWEDFRNDFVFSCKDNEEEAKKVLAGLDNLVRM